MIESKQNGTNLLELTSIVVIPTEESKRDESSSPLVPISLRGQASSPIPSDPLLLETKSEERPAQRFLCSICMEEHDADAMIRNSCGHRFCRQCMLEFARIKINDGQVRAGQMQCPDLICQVRFDVNIILGDLDPAVRNKYFKFLEAAKLDGNHNVRWCPTPDCETPLVGKRWTKKLKCHKCGVLTCFKCGKEYHKSTPCSLEEREFLEWAKDKKVKNCPRCKIRVTKVDGCNVMTCSCGHKFCWLCLRSVSRNHYKAWNLIYGCPGMQNEGYEWDFVRSFLWRLVFFFLVPIAVLIAWPVGGLLYLVIYPLSKCLAPDLAQDMIYTFSWYFLSCYYTFWDPFEQFQ